MSMLEELEELLKRANRPKPKRQLTSIEVAEVSVVDNPAVGDATFLIAKRLTPEDQQLAAILDSDPADLEKLATLAATITSGLETVAERVDQSRALLTGAEIIAACDRIGSRLEQMERAIG